VDRETFVGALRSALHERYRERRPDVVLMDLSMPIMDGLAVTRAILEKFPYARIVNVSVVVSIQMPKMFV
jgi:DNA-binding NarL/FixJ family response regulator